MQRLPCRFPWTGWREKESPQQISLEADTTCGERAQEAGNAVPHKHRHTHIDTHARTHRLNSRHRGSVVVTEAVVVLLQLRANTHTIKHRRADSSRPLER
ncbi:Hypothetical predicted protein [Scomber scombrus]|uniref:Uncharacterized protein n=1 Tax=Scomber scombrus TaxID=13677 RepID=A0AAV1PYK5_SCOSC